MKDFSVLIGGQAGEGINLAGQNIVRLLNQLGYHLYMYYDYPSLIKGGHNFSIIRAADHRIAAHRDAVDFLLALNQDCIDRHRQRIHNDTVIIYDSNAVKAEGIGIDFYTIVKEEKAPYITRNTGMIGAFCRAAGIEWDILEKLLRRTIPKAVDLNVTVARRGFDEAREARPIGRLSGEPHPLVSGNEAIGLGLLKGGLSLYVAYPMTPTSSLLSFLAGAAKEFSIKVVHPENEIAVMLMALGCSYAGERVAVGTSGGGFCLMTEGLSLAGQAELPVVIVLGQRTGPSTGLPTYTAQTELLFAIHAGQGEFPRMVVAPGDAEEAYSWSAIALNIAMKYQVPAFILSDKTLGEGTYHFLRSAIGGVQEEAPLVWQREGPYRRYAVTPSGISPLAYPPAGDAVIKVNSYFHDEGGFTTESAETVRRMQEKVSRKENAMRQELATYEQVLVHGDTTSPVALLCWGSNKGVAAEVAGELGVQAIQPVVLWPFPEEQFRRSCAGVSRLIAVENSATSQLSTLIGRHGIPVDTQILKNDGRPFSIEELTERVSEVLS
jgi:2-oxoglutarate/2-oxoacid ferredoxin oxidoreductase subunit alpha